MESRLSGRIVPDSTGRRRAVAAKFSSAGITPIAGFAAERDLAPRLPRSPTAERWRGGMRRFRWSGGDPGGRSSSTGRRTGRRRRRGSDWRRAAVVRVAARFVHVGAVSGRRSADPAGTDAELDPLEGGFTLVALKRESGGGGEVVDFGDSFVSFGLAASGARSAGERGVVFRRGWTGGQSETWVLRRLGVTEGQVKGLRWRRGWRGRRWEWRRGRCCWGRCMGG